MKLHEDEVTFMHPQTKVKKVKKASFEKDNSEKLEPMKLMLLENAMKKQ
ncbi:MAG: hypothetical protein ACLSBH_14455 [Coprobacillus cateniformis]